VWGEANSEFAVAWLSRLPIRRWENHRLPVLDKTLLELDVGVHLFATHLSAGQTKADEPHRNEETAAILRELGDGPRILVGDFNAVHPQDEIGDPPPDELLDHVSREPIARILAAGFTDCYRGLHADRGWTYLAWHPWARLDYVFTRGLDASRCDVVESDASDHFALVAELN